MDKMGQVGAVMGQVGAHMDRVGAYIVVKEIVFGHFDYLFDLRLSLGGA